jgi:hypothetical protein
MALHELCTELCTHYQVRVLLQQQGSRQTAGRGSDWDGRQIARTQALLKADIEALAGFAPSTPCCRRYVSRCVWRLISGGNRLLTLQKVRGCPAEVIETGTEMIMTCKCKQGAQGIGRQCDGIFEYRWLLGLCSDKAGIKSPI